MSPRPTPWTSEVVRSSHAYEAEHVSDLLGVEAPAGLAESLAVTRMAEVGPNKLPEAPAKPAWRVLAAQFKSLLILILLGASALAASIGSYKDAAVILAVVVINALVGFYQEYRAERSLAALKSMLPPQARVRRDGVSQQIPADLLVPGDVVLLEAGDRVPADGRLVMAASVEVDESSLTGESLPVRKQADTTVAQTAPLGDRVNVAYMNTLVTRGRAELVVTATGPDTEMGRLSLALAAAEQPATPLQIQLDGLGKRLGAIALSLVALLSFLQYLRGEDLLHIALDAIALSMAAMPEGLPVVVTVTLALGMRKLAQQHAIVKRLASVETLGCTTVICSDKTGTLTLNQMTVRSFWFREASFDVTGEGYQAEGRIEAPAAQGNQMPVQPVDLAPLLVPLVACNDSHVAQGQAVGDPMEAALLVLAQKGGLDRAQTLDQFPRIAELPFDSAHKFMATFHRDGDRILMFVKGAPDVLLSRCTHWLGSDGLTPLTPEQRQEIEAHYQSIASRGLRGLVVASKSLPSDALVETYHDLSSWVSDLTFVGLLGLMDPPRAEARQAIAECRQAGIAVKMITGDHPTTASAIAAELGLHGRVLSGTELDAMDSAQLAAAIDDVVVFARVTPSHKVKLVLALQAKGHVVAMTGDGVNDAPALKQADIGVAMGINGTAVSKEAATMVLTDDNFATIVRAVHQGRTLYDNILKFVRFQLSTTIGAILTIFFAPLAGLPEPFTAVQILWVAIIMDGPLAVSLAMDAARPGLMTERPRPRSEPVLPLPRVLHVMVFGLMMMMGTLFALRYGIQTGEQDRALTLAFTTFTLFQFFNLFNARAETGSAFHRRFFANRMLWISLSCTLLLQILAVHWPPAAGLFQTTGMRWSDWLLATAIASTVLWVEEGRKLLMAKRQR